MTAMASGPPTDVGLPNIRGIDAYTGHKIHSARWDHDYHFAGKRVAVIGTGASAVQIIPELVEQAKQVKVFQRTPAWVLPRLDHRHPGWLRQAFEAVTLGLVWDSVFTTAVQAIARAHLRSAVRDPWLRRQLTPDFRIGCKRVLMSSDYYPALQRDNCKLITWPIATLAPNGIRTAEGIEHQADCIVFATGFDV